MPYTIQCDAAAPILVVTQEPGSDAIRELEQGIADITQALDMQAEPVFLILSVEGVRLPISMINRAAELGARGSHSVLHHHNLRETVVVSTSRLVRTAMQVLTGPSFGEVRLAFADSPEQALDYCRAALAR